MRSVAFVTCLWLLQSVNALFFYVGKSQHRCFFLDIPTDTFFRAEYESPDSTDAMRAALTIYVPTPNGPKENEVAKRELTIHKGTVPFTSTVNGQHWICISIDGSEYEIPDTARMRFSLKLAMGASSREYQDLAKKGHMDELQLVVLKLRDRVRRLQSYQDYWMKKNQQFELSIQSNNRKAMWVSVFQIAILLFTAFFQVRHLRKYFEKKKLV